MSNYTQPICERCWIDRETSPEGAIRMPVRKAESEVESCAFCGHLTIMGAYVRANPEVVPYPKLTETELPVAPARMVKKTPAAKKTARKAALKHTNATPLEHSSEVLFSVHDESTCAGRACAIHRRSDHTMRSFPQHWRSDRRLMERICPHGVGHPDPDNWDYLVAMLGEDDAGAEMIHGCCAKRCCRAA
jgi:hypothetical protein